MPAQQVKQQLKNGAYRGIGELAARLPRRERGRTLRVLMYHKLSAVPGNTCAIAPSVFEQQMAALARWRYVVVPLAAAIAHVRDGAPLPERAVLLTFDDGYRDNHRHALPVLRRYGYPAVLFVTTGFVGGDRALPHDEHLAARGIENPVLSWDEVRELDASGVRVESHGVTHRPFATLTDAEVVEELERSKARLEQELDREVEAFAFPRGSALDLRPAHDGALRAAGYRVAFTTLTGANGPDAPPFRLRRYNVEPYPLRTLELVLDGACDAVAVKDTRLGTHARRAANSILRSGPT